LEQLTEKHRSLIESIIRKNPRFTGNEDLVDDFCSETFKRAYSIISSFNDINNFDLYLNKVASTAIIEVLRNSGRLRRASSGYQKVKEEPKGFMYELDGDKNIAFDIPDPAPNFEDALIQEEEIKTIRDIILQIDAKEKNKRYLDIFSLRYIKNMNQAQIATEIGISQGEISKRLTELAKKINKCLGYN
jgi:RNA polymerase sigma factor (sigma-70 family)